MTQNLGSCKVWIIGSSVCMYVGVGCSFLLPTDALKNFPVTAFPLEEVFNLVLRASLQTRKATHKGIKHG